MSRKRTRKAFWLRKMARRTADADSPGNATELSAERDLLSLARMLHYAKCEAEALGQSAAAALVDAALLSLNGDAPGSRVRGVLADQPTRTQPRKFC